MEPRPKRSYKMIDAALNEQIQKLVRHAGNFPDQDLLAEMIVTALKVGEDGMDRGDIRLINTAMKELRYAFKVFNPYRHIRKVAIFGSARIPKKSPAYQQAREFARLIVKQKWMVITGAASGIMNAGNEGATRENSFGVNIRLPFEQEANPAIEGDPKLVNFKYFFTRKLIFVAESDATVLCPGGFGTHDEGFETLTLVQTGKAEPRPIICLDPPGSNYWSSWKRFLENHLAETGMIDPADMGLVKFTHSPEEAVKMICDFYSNYHSMRYIGGNLVIRIQKPLLPAKLKKLIEDFSGIIRKGTIEQVEKPFEEEMNDPQTHHLTRLVFCFDRRHFSRLIHMVEAINDAGRAVK